jgi:deoxyadenosine/deoxycytidine kinase
MKIGVSGVHGSGKSTKVLELARDYKVNNPNLKIGIIQENIINCPYEINQNTTLLSQYWIISDQIKTELEYSKRYDIVITDRTVFDPICYAIAANLIKEAEIFYNYTKMFGFTYDKIYLMKGKSEYCFDDGLRDLNPEFRNKIDEEFSNLYERLQKENFIKELVIID